ncbi:DUF5415 family protein [Enterococcus faecalis]|uniref:Uncharacterized protein n=1 Tax=Enterococcus faecalis RP2S-4 TaxID=1244145 RepID=A0ABC9TJW4_ENTFL|nr:DUF5415 family protein [Enterococcus faecalis]EPI08717.1 hypothetical protein D358_01492 [Enterococcus faecalis RP2S-4]
MAKKKTEEQVLTEKILTKQNKSFPEWKKETLEKIQFDFFRGQDTELEAYVMQREMRQLIMKESKKLL